MKKTPVVTLEITMEHELLNLAWLAREKAYAPYSKYKVGAALECMDGSIYVGSNVENCSYGLTICAERVAITKAVSDGKKAFRRIVVVAEGAGPLTMPCGACRQFLAEFGTNVRVIVSNDRTKFAEAILKDILPMAFLPESLPR